MHRTLISLLIASLTIATVAQARPKKDKINLPKIFHDAHYVYIEPYEGDRGFPELLAEDRLAILNVQKQLSDWARYSVTTSRAQADFVLVVHRGRRSNDDDGPMPPSSSGPVVYGGGQRPQGKSPFPSGGSDPSSTSAGNSRGNDDEIATPEDQLSAYIPNGSDNSLTTRIWTHSQRNGLNGQQPPLFKRLKDDVEAAYPK